MPSPRRDCPVAISPYGRPVIWVVLWTRGETRGFCSFTQKSTALRYAISQALPKVDWSSFPFRGEYPCEERDGSNEALSPVFRANWEGGSVEVHRAEVETEDFLPFQLNVLTGEIYRQLGQRGVR